jgi:type 1 glutamine amidotransferase
VIQQLGRDSGAFTVDYARVTPPQGPKKPTEPKKIDDEAKAQAAREKYEAEMKVFNEAETRFKEEEKVYAAEQKRVLAEKLSLDSLKGYDAVIFANTTGDLPLPDPKGFIEWVKAGHGFVGTHSASDTFHGFKPYVEMLGGEFQTHDDQAGVECINEDPSHPACQHLESRFAVFDEIYLIKTFERTHVHMLLGLDKEPNKKTPGYFPIAWCKQVGEGRVFYTSLGHREDVWDPEWKGRKNSPEVALSYQKHLLHGIKWALGLEAGDAKPQTASK